MTRREEGSTEPSNSRRRRTILKTVATAIISVLIAYWIGVIAFFAIDIATTLADRASDPVVTVRNQARKENHARKSLVP